MLIKLFNKIYNNEIRKKKISFNSTPYFIAEISVNPKTILQEQKNLLTWLKGGAHGVKFQTYKAEKIACKKSPYYWDINEIPENTQYKLFKKFDKFNYRIQIKKTL